MLEFQPDARAYLSKIRALSTDKDDKVVFVGLTAKESVWYANYVEDSFSGTADRTNDSQEKYLELMDRHEEARLAVIAEEDPVQEQQPSHQ